MHRYFNTSCKGNYLHPIRGCLAPPPKFSGHPTKIRPAVGSVITASAIVSRNVLDKQQVVTYLQDS